MKPTIRILFFILILVSLAACTPMPVPTATIPPTLTSMAFLADTLVPTATLAPSFTPEATATEVVNPEVERKRNIVNQINEFLSASGQYSDENLAKYIFQMGMMKYQYPGYKDDLGLMMAWDPEIGSMQGINLGGVEGENCVWYFFGTKMGEDGQRVVVPVRIPLEYIDYRIPILISFYDQRDISPAGSNSAIYLDDKQLKLTTAKEILEILNGELLGRPILINKVYKDDEGTSFLRVYVPEHGGTDEDLEAVLELFSEMASIYHASFCDFHPSVKDMLDNYSCGTGYTGTEISSEVAEFNEDWVKNEGNLWITILTSYIDESH